jgi:hypothetical protein
MNSILPTCLVLFTVWRTSHNVDLHAWDAKPFGWRRFTFTAVTNTGYKSEQVACRTIRPARRKKWEEHHLSYSTNRENYRVIKKYHEGQCYSLSSLNSNRFSWLVGGGRQLNTDYKIRRRCSMNMVVQIWEEGLGPFHFYGNRYSNIWNVLGFARDYYGAASQLRFYSPLHYACPYLCFLRTDVKLAAPSTATILDVRHHPYWELRNHILHWIENNINWDMNATII